LSKWYAPYEDDEKVGAVAGAEAQQVAHAVSTCIMQPKPSRLLSDVAVDCADPRSGYAARFTA
jgi:hypothetical protein